MIHNSPRYSHITSMSAIVAKGKELPEGAGAQHYGYKAVIFTLYLASK
jgi:hypothetical protein